jgi:hypothetical protein
MRIFPKDDGVTRRRKETGRRSFGLPAVAFGEGRLFEK